MHHASLVSFLDGVTTPNQFWLEIEAEVNACLAAISEQGGIGHVIISDGPETIVERRHLHTLVVALADGELPLKAAAYIADALIMSDSLVFADDEISDTAGRLSDESGPLSVDELEVMRVHLSGRL